MGSPVSESTGWAPASPAVARTAEDPATVTAADRSGRDYIRRSDRCIEVWA